MKRYLLDLTRCEPYVSHIKMKMEHKNGCRLQQAIVYHPVLAALLFSDKFPVTGGLTVNGQDYQEPYINGFVEGQAWFMQNYGSGDPYNEKFKADLIVQYNNIGHRHEGWNFVKSSYPVILSPKIIEEYGFYSGIVFEYENLLKKHPSLDIDSSKPKGLSARQQALYAYYEGDILTPRYRPYSAYTFCNAFKNDRNELITAPDKRSAKSKIKDFEKIIPLLKESRGNRAIDDLSILKRNCGID